MTDLTSYRGGHGISPCGHTRAGGAASLIEPRFLSSRPSDKQKGVSLTQVLRFFVYNYTSFTDIPNIRIRISEDAGATFVAAFDSTGFLAPYDGVESKIQRRDGHTLAIFIQKASNWARATKIVIEYEGEDEYGNVATRVLPVRW